MQYREVLKRSLKTVIPSLVVVGWGALASAQTTKVLVGHIPNAVKKMADEGKIDESQMLSVTIALQLQNQDELNQKLIDLYNPKSSSYHQFLTPAEFNARYAPTAEQVAQEVSRLEAQGIQVKSVSDNRLLIKVQANVATLNQVFGTELHQYRKLSTQKAYFAPSQDPQVPSDSLISAVVGLNNLSHYHSYLKTNKMNSSGTKPNGSGPDGGMVPSDIRAAYGINADGTGQTLALFELDGYTDSDITTYEQKYNLPNVNLQNVLLDGSTGAAGEGADEVTLDIELMTAVAPNASKILVYEGPNSDQGLLDTYAKIASDNLAKQVSTSWGQPEDQAAASDLQAENTTFTQMVAQGQALYAAAGDSGANDDGSKVSVDDPSSQPNVVAVGGTTLKVDTNGKYVSETTWNELNSSEGAGGGGISTVWTIPTWQQGAITADTQGSTTMRNTPDVSFNADPVTGYDIYVGGQWEIVGGTSAAAPVWAAFTALVNQQREAKGLTDIGFTNPAIYALGKSANSSSLFHDVADGSNNGFYDAFTGYDNATGWGSFQSSSLLSALATQ
jgi:kumamolisin